MKQRYGGFIAAGGPPEESAWTSSHTGRSTFSDSEIMAVLQGLVDLDASRSIRLLKLNAKAHMKVLKKAVKLWLALVGWTKPNKPNIPTSSAHAQCAKATKWFLKDFLKFCFMQIMSPSSPD